MWAGGSLMAAGASCRCGQRTQDIEVLMTDLDNRAGWWPHAACLAADPELFFPISSSGPAIEQVAQAKAICDRCRIRPACLAYALDAGPVQGIWGGTTEAERGRLRARCTRATALRVQHLSRPQVSRPVRPPAR